MGYRLAALMALVIAAVSVPSVRAIAAEPPAFARASGEEKARLQALVDAALKEGQLSYWDVVIQPETNDALTAQFRAMFGLPPSFKVNYTLTNSSGMVTRLDQELRANRVTIDVAAIASPPWVFERAREGKILAYASPQYRRYTKAFAAGLGQDGAFAFNGAYLFIPAWNSETSEFGGTSWRDLLGAVPAGRMSIGDAGKSETHLETYMGLRKILGRDFFEGIARMSPTFLVRSEQIASRLIAGEDLLAMSGSIGRSYQFNQRGAKLKFVLPSEGVVLLPQLTFILKDAPHPAAAKLWIDYILSEEGQTTLVNHEAMISGRDGFESPVADYAPAMEKLKLVPMDWGSVTLADMEAARAEWLAIFNR